MVENSGSGRDENDPEMPDAIHIVIGSTTGAIVLLFLLLLLLTLFLLFKIIKILRVLVSIQQQNLDTSEDNEKGVKTAVEPDQNSLTEPRSPNKESPEQPPEGDSAAMYSVVSKEHCEKKKKASFEIQQYDTFSPEPDTKAQEPYENVHVESKLRTASVTIEHNPESPNYSLLSHPGPRLSQTKRQEQRERSREKSKQKDRKGSLSAVKSKEDSSSEAHTSSSPSSQVIPTNERKYTGTFDGKDNLPPPVASRSSISKPAEKTPKSSDRHPEPAIPYEIVPITNVDETDEIMSEIRFTHSGEKAVVKGTYELVN